MPTTDKWAAKPLSAVSPYYFAPVLRFASFLLRAEFQLPVSWSLCAVAHQPTSKSSQEPGEAWSHQTRSTPRRYFDDLSYDEFAE